MTPDQSSENSLIEKAHLLHQQELERFARGVLKDPALAADAVQNAFVALSQSLHSINPASVRGWLYTVTLREAIRIRKQTRRFPTASNIPNVLLHVRESEILYQVDPSEKLANEEVVDRIRGRIRELPNEQREVFDLRVRGEMSFADIATQLNIPLGTALSRMRLALQKLRAEISDDLP